MTYLFCTGEEFPLVVLMASLLPLPVVLENPPPSLRHVDIFYLVDNVLINPSIGYLRKEYNCTSFLAFCSKPISPDPGIIFKE